MGKGKSHVFPSLGLFKCNIKEAEFLHGFSKYQKTTSCCLALFSVFNKRLLECHICIRKRKAFLGYVVLLALTFPSKMFLPSLQKHMLRNFIQTPECWCWAILLQLKPIFFLFSPQSENFGLCGPLCVLTALQLILPLHKPAKAKLVGQKRSSCWHWQRGTCKEKDKQREIRAWIK